MCLLKCFYLCSYLANYFSSLEIDECSSSPCENSGTCTDDVSGYTCQCAAGYTDTVCQTGKQAVNTINAPQIKLVWMKYVQS